MEILELEYKRKNGVYYTPDILADFLVKEFSQEDKVGNTSILDPSYGDGALLRAYERSVASNTSKNKKIGVELHGCDINPVNGLLKHLPQANLVQCDFFDYCGENRFDVVLTNPPYIRHQSREKRLPLEFEDQFKFLGNISDTWAYFLVKATFHLNKKGRIAAILPWSFLEANYSIGLRDWLTTKFARIKVLGISHPYFEKAQERVVMLWLDGFGGNCDEIKIGYVNDINEDPVYQSVSIESWIAPRVLLWGWEKLQGVISYLRESHNYKPFKEVADIRIGVVTGANQYFIKTSEEASKLGFQSADLNPIITSASDLVQYLQNGKSKLKRILDVRRKHKNYIKLGLENSIHERSHSKSRDPWYSVNTGKVPDAFFPYRVGKLPFLVISKGIVQSTNSVHRIYFKDLTDIQQKWVAVSLMSKYGQLDILANAKSYGRNMTKIEPGSLGKVHVYSSDQDSVCNVYQEVTNLIVQNKRFEAVDLATTFIDNQININKSTRKVVDELWQFFYCSDRGN